MPIDTAMHDGRWKAGVALDDPKLSPLSDRTGTRSIAGLRLRAAGEADMAVLKQLYLEWQMPQFASLPWSEPQKLAIVEGQFAMQNRQFAAQFPAADFWIVTDPHGKPIGRFYLDRAGPEWRLIELLLAAEHRGRRLGGELIRWLQGEAAVAGAALTLAVAINNPGAKRFYLRHGFSDRDFANDAAHCELHWRASSRTG